LQKPANTKVVSAHRKLPIS